MQCIHNRHFRTWNRSFDGHVQTYLEVEVSRSACSPNAHHNAFRTWPSRRFIEHGGGPKREDSLCGLRPCKRDITWKLPLRTRWIFCGNKPRKSDEAGPWINIVRERSRRMVNW